MTEHYDDMMRDRLNSHESPVPQDMFNNIRTRLDAMDQSFDAVVNDAISNYASPVPANLFNQINSQLEVDDAAFDAAIAGKVNSYDSEVPADMWQRIMNEKDKRRPVAWWWAAALLFLLAGSAGFYKILQNTKGNRQQPIATGEKNNGTRYLNSDTGIEKNELAVTPGNVAGRVKEVALTDSLGHNDAQAVNNTATGKEYLNSANSNDIVSISNYNSSNAFSSNKKNKRKNSGSYGNEEANTTHYKEIDAALTDEEAQNQPGATTDPNLAASANKQLALRLMIRSAFNKLAPLQLLQAKYPILPCPTTGDVPRNDWYLDAYVSPMMVFKNVTDKTAGKNVGMGMDSTLYKQLSFNAGVSLVKNIGENFLLKTGVQFNLVNELFKQTRVNEVKLITTVTVRTVILSPGDTIYIRDTSVTQQIGTVTRQTQNHYKSWDIPLILGYEFGGKDLRLNANLGIIANIKSKYQGDILLDSTRQAINLTNYKGTGVYKTSVGLGIYAGLAILKAIGDRTDIMVEPYARYNISNTTTDAAWFKQKNIVAGVSLGIRYKLNGRRQR